MIDLWAFAHIKAVCPRRHVSWVRLSKTQGLNPSGEEAVPAKNL